MENGKELVLFALHMSAYGNSDEIRKAQISMLCEDMERNMQRAITSCAGEILIMT